MSEVDVKEPGLVVPVKFPNNGDVLLVPLYIFKKSKLFSAANEAKLTVTNCPGNVGHIVVVMLSFEEYEAVVPPESTKFPPH